MKLNLLQPFQVIPPSDRFYKRLLIYAVFGVLGNLVLFHPPNIPLFKDISPTIGDRWVAIAYVQGLVCIVLAILAFISARRSPVLASFIVKIVVVSYFIFLISPVGVMILFSFVLPPVWPFAFGVLWITADLAPRVFGGMPRRSDFVASWEYNSALGIAALVFALVLFGWMATTRYPAPLRTFDGAPSGFIYDNSARDYWIDNQHVRVARACIWPFLPNTANHGGRDITDGVEMAVKLPTFDCVNENNAQCFKNMHDCEDVAFVTIGSSLTIPLDKFASGVFQSHHDFARGDLEGLSRYDSELPIDYFGGTLDGRFYGFSCMQANRVSDPTCDNAGDLAGGLQYKIEFRRSNLGKWREIMTSGGLFLRKLLVPTG